MRSNFDQANASQCTVAETTNAIPAVWLSLMTIMVRDYMLIEEITEAMETIELIVHDNDEDGDDDVVDGVHDDDAYNKVARNEILTLALATNDSINMSNSTYSSLSSIISTRTNLVQHQQHDYGLGRRPSCDVATTNNSNNTSTLKQQQQSQQIAQNQTVSSPNLLASPLLRLANNAPPERCNSGSYLGRRSSMTTPDSGVSSQTYMITNTASTITPTHSAATPQPTSPRKVKSIGIGTTTRTYCDKSVNSSPIHVVSTLTSPIDTHNSMISVTREHALKQEIEQLQERLKDTEERLESFRIQHDTVSQLHRKLRESNTQLQEESEILKLDVQHLNECANVLRTELQAARHDRDEALDLQKVLQNELEETRAEKKRAQEQKERDAKTIQDLQRQCREMERILMRKHPDSVSALIVASKSGGGSHNDQENHSSRKLLEQRIAQLESDAKEQDLKAQQILANVQARFNSVQAKYETHIADLETQVLSLQEINTKLNEKIESQVRTLDYFVSKKAERYYNNCTQTEEPFIIPIPVPAPAPLVLPAEPKLSRTHNRKTISTQTISATRESGTNTIGTSSQHSASSSTSSTANSTPNNSRPNSKQSGIRKPMATASSLTSAVASKLPISQSDSTISLSAAQAAASAKEDAHLLATIRGMRVDLAIKNKALQRLTRELDECKKTIRKIQKEKEAFKYERSHSTAASSSSSKYNVEHMPASTESQALKEAQNKYKLLEADYKSLHEKRLQDLKTLQTAHERELATCHETVRILQQRLNERDEQFALQKRRKVPVDYYALKAKVSSLERRHTEREERLHMLVEALSKGRLNGALDDLLGDNNNQ
ncbi:centrosomal protein of 162 kDa-like [Lucilia sericata]|uniref:centrosomal protein of 162 kDa-like n=1 Tax=Lucilia sericata TaxID=13632 RepID=UPI0018A82D1C|nr:centrosomal protein of 162 kDa-like [Lucilia sericata]